MVDVIQKIAALTSPASTPSAQLLDLTNIKVTSSVVFLTPEQLGRGACIISTPHEVETEHRHRPVPAEGEANDCKRLVQLFAPSYSSSHLGQPRDTLGTNLSS